MAFKTISLSEKAYRRLKAAQRRRESFSQQIIRITSTRKISEIVGIFSDAEAKTIREGVERVRKSARVRKWR